MPQAAIPAIITAGATLASTGAQMGMQLAQDDPAQQVGGGGSNPFKGGAFSAQPPQAQPAPMQPLEQNQQPIQMPQGPMPFKNPYGGFNG